MTAILLHHEDVLFFLIVSRFKELAKSLGAVLNTEKNKNPYLYIRNISNLKTPFEKANL
jgi:hypothetical protein